MNKPRSKRRKRQIFKKIGISKPESHTFQIDYLSHFRDTHQNAEPKKPFRNPEDKKNTIDYIFSEYTQLPSDWKLLEIKGER